MKVSILKRQLANNRIGLYLQYSQEVRMPTGRMSRRESTGLFLYGGKRLSSEEREHNRETEKVIEVIRSRRLIEVQTQEHIGVEKNMTMLSDYLAKVGESEGRSITTRRNWRVMIGHVKKAKIDRPISELRVVHCADFRRYLLGLVAQGQLKQSSAHTRLSSFRAGLRTAYREGVITENLNERFDPIGLGEAAKKEFLTMEELTRLLATPTKYRGLRTLVFFAALTGLRTSELRELEWSGIHDSPKGSVMTYYQRKTKRWKSRPMPTQARKLIGERPEYAGKVFPHIYSQTFLNTILRRWAEEAGIKQHLSMHCMRHTFATLQLSAGTQLKVVSEMLDHSSVQMTEVYAKVLDSALAEASEKVVVDVQIDQSSLRIVRKSVS